MLTQIKASVAQLVPVHFTSEVPLEQIRSILDETFADNDVFCKPAETWVVVDRDTPAEGLFKEACSGSPLHGIRLKILEKNRGKTGAIRVALEWALAESGAEFFVTRDCDGDNRIEDLPRLVLLANALQSESPGPCSIFGCRPSLSKPMSWERLQWETITNQVVFDLTSALLAKEGRALVKNFWNQPALDLQSGYRLYNREAATLAARSLAVLPDERETYLLACEISPFIEISLAGGVIGQVFRSTQVEQPVSSYAGMDFARLYGLLLAHYADCYKVERPLLRQFLDNALVESDAMQSRLREQLLECRTIIDPSAPKLRRPPLL